jgi:RNA polymerase subunit RPABC4/transcription elongation factor Spt4
VKTPTLPCPVCAYMVQVDSDYCPCGKLFSGPEMRERWERVIHVTGLPKQTTLDGS